MNLTEQIKVFDSLDLKSSNKRNIKAISRLLNEAKMINTSSIDTNNSNNNSNMINNNSTTQNNKVNMPSRRLEELKEITERYRLPKLEPIIDEKQKVKVSQDQQKKVTRVNLYGYESIQEEPFPVIKRLSPKQKEVNKKMLKPQLESLIKKPILRNFKSSFNEKKGIVFKEAKLIDDEKRTPIISQPKESIQLSEKSKELSATISSVLSEDANYAMLKTYEDMIYFDILNIYPDTENLSRTKTNDFIQIPRKIPPKLPPINSRLSEHTERTEPDDEEVNKQDSEIRTHQIKISQHLEKAMLISDIIKKAKGELTTTNRSAKVNNIIGAFNEWKNNWQQSMCQA